MKSRAIQIFSALNEAFWLLPGLMVLTGIVGAGICVELDRSGAVPLWLIEGSYLYNGGGTGARTLLGAVVSSTISVAGTVFSITIAALALTAGQMGPRLLRNFTRDRGNQATLGAFLGTFSFALIVLRAVRTQTEGEFVPHLSLSISIFLALVCVATLVYFVGHTAGRINVDTVVELVGSEMRDTVGRLTDNKLPVPPPDPHFWKNAILIADSRRGYLQHLDYEGLAEWAAARGTSLHLFVRPGDYVFPGAAIGEMIPPVDGAHAAILEATVLGPQRVSALDLEFSIRQLVEVAVRALSPGINDPHTAISVLHRLAATLCDIARVNLPTGVMQRAGHPVLVVPSVDYDGIVDAMFNMIRQSAARNPAILISLLDSLAAVLTCEKSAGRVKTLERHVDLVLTDARRADLNPSDLNDMMDHHARLVAAQKRSSSSLSIT